VKCGASRRPKEIHAPGKDLGKTVFNLVGSSWVMPSSAMTPLAHCVCSPQTPAIWCTFFRRSRHLIS